MVDPNKEACCKIAVVLYKENLWPESYITWDCLHAFPRAMEPGYLNVNWNHILGLFLQKNYLHTLVISTEEWSRLSHRDNVQSYWEPTEDQKDFHKTLALVFCWSVF